MTREAALRERVQTATKRPSRRKAWEAPAVTDFATGICVRAFDQSLTNTGWVDIEIWPGLSEIRVWGRGTIKIAVASKGHTSTMDKADVLKQRLESFAGGWDGDLVVGEVTPVMGYRLESSLMAGYVLRQVYRKVDFVSRQSALALLLPPDKRHEKIHSRLVLERYLLVGTAAQKRWNEHERDALMLALTRLHQMAQEGS